MLADFLTGSGAFLQIAAHQAPRGDNDVFPQRFIAGRDRYAGFGPFAHGIQRGGRSLFTHELAHGRSLALRTVVLRQIECSAAPHAPLAFPVGAGELPE